MPKKKKKGLLSDDKARVGYQEGEEVKVVPTREELLKQQEEEEKAAIEAFRQQLIQEATDAGWLRDISYIEKYTDKEILKKIEDRKELIERRDQQDADKKMDADMAKGRKNYEEGARDMWYGGGLLSDDKDRMAYAEGEEVAAEDEDMEGVAISISPVTATKEDIEQVETADTDEMVSDNEMEQDHLDFIIDNALDKEDEAYLMEVLQADSRLSMIFDRVMDTASEFSGDGPVEGLGSEVSDSIPARLSDGEFVMTAKAADEIGPDNLQNMMDEAEEVSDNRQQAAQGGAIEDNKPKINEFGKPVDEDIAEDEIKKGMLSVNPRLQ